MHIEEIKPPGPPAMEDLTVAAVLREIGISIKNVVQSEIKLAKAELADSTLGLSAHLRQMALFGAVLLLSVPPFMAFLVIGLGRLLGDNYWLSALLISITFALVGGLMAARALRRIRGVELKLVRSRASLERTKAMVTDKIEEIKFRTGRAA